MLDIVMTAHHANYKRMAHRGLKVVPGRESQKMVMGSLVTAVDLVGTPGKVVLSLEGGDRQGFEPAEAYLQSQALAWQIVHSDEVTSYKAALMRGLEQCHSPLVAVIPPWIEVNDKLWVQRMIWAIGKDPTCLLCGTYERQGAAKDLAPNIMNPRLWPGGEFFVARRDKLWQNLVLSQEEDFYDELAKAAALNGWRIWAHPGVRFINHDHEDHARKTVGEEAGTTTADSHS